MDIDKIKQTLEAHGYAFVEQIGEGASAKVLLCRSKKYNNLFAVKLVSKQTLIRQEIDALISLIHPFIVFLSVNTLNKNTLAIFYNKKRTKNE